MAIAQTGEATVQKPLRLWPGVLIVALQWLARFVVPVVVPDAAWYGMFGGLVAGLAILVWWAFFSRAPRAERWGAVVLMIVAVAVTPRILHESVAEGNLGFQFHLYAIPVLSLAFVVWAVAGRRLADGPRRATMVATILLACGVFALLRSKGVTGDAAAELTWRWAETAEERLLAQAGDGPVATPAATDLAGGRPEPDWPGLRGPHRDGVVPGVRIETDWSRTPPVELWRRPIGPGVSSFAVGGGLLYTQEQRGEDEVVACYNATSGEPVWMHRDAIRFWDPHVGAGPRATPALGDGRVYTLGATGIVNALDAADGSVVWSRNAAPDAGAKLPRWGFVSSPLVAGDVVVVHAGALVAYDLASGEPRWRGPAGGSYCSPHLATLDGVAQILMLGHSGATSFAPADGTMLWEHSWPGSGFVQPVLTADGDVLIGMVDSVAFPTGTRRVAVAHGPGGWSVEERWTSRELKPHFSAFVVHRGHAFGFDGRILACIDLEDGERRWKGGRYGSGQLLLLPDQDLLLVVSEQGDLALVRAAPDRFTELARWPAIEGRTWNQPALVGGVLLVRNGEEMAALRLPLAGG